MVYIITELVSDEWEESPVIIRYCSLDRVKAEIVLSQFRMKWGYDDKTGGVKPASDGCFHSFELKEISLDQIKED